MGETALPRNELKDAMRIGKFDAAVQIFQKVSGIKDIGKDRNGFASWCERFAKKQAEKGLWDPVRIETATLGAEFLYYIGMDKKASLLLSDYTRYKDELFATGGNIPSAQTEFRLGLLLAKQDHKNREFGPARDFSKKIRDWYLDKLDEMEGDKAFAFWCAALCSSQMASSYSRMDAYKEAEFHCDRAIEFLARAGEGLALEESCHIVWHTGLVWLTEGNIAWITGDLESGERKLRIAQFHLEMTKDFINRANVNRSLGGVLFAKGEYWEAERVFQYAEDGYLRINHEANLARLYLNIGENYYDLAKKLYKEDGNNYLEKFEDAEKHLIKSEEISKSIENKRQRARALTKLSRLYGDERFEQCMEKSDNLLRRGENLLKTFRDKRRSQLEADFARGIYLMRKKEYREAEGKLNSALREAEEWGVLLYQAQAHLHIAELICKKILDESSTEIDKALYNKEACISIMKDQYYNNDIKEQLKEVNKMISRIEKGGNYLIIYGSDIIEPLGLKDAEDRVRIFSVVSALKKTGGKKGEAAKLLNITRPTFSKFYGMREKRKQ